MSSSIAAIAARWSPVGVNGSESRSQRSVSSPGGAKRRRLRALAPLGPAAQQRELEHEQLVEREPAAAALLVAEVRGGQRGGPVGQPLAGPQPRRAAARRMSRISLAALVDHRRDLGGREAVRGRVGGHLVPGRRLAR